ncbi:MAG: histidinol-phosphate transaminase [Acidimicrobiia bacterium]|nr:histidinol-phosphate transaminase [Acidimicrobiia bacterium]
MSGDGPRLRDDLSELVGYHSPDVDVDVRLNTNESPYPPPRGFVDALAGAAPRIAYNRYPDREARVLRAAIAASIGVDPGSVWAGNGSNEVIQVLLLAFGGSQRRALVFAPTYSMHTKIAEATATAVVTEARDADFTVDAAAVEDACVRHRPDIVFFCSPNNPTGTLEPHDAVTVAAADSRRLVIVDEAYAEFCDETAVGMVATHPNVVVVRTMSKAWSMPALRLGYLVAPPELVRALTPAHLPYHLNAFTQEAGRLALDYGAEMRTRVALAREERGRLYAELAACEGVRVWPSAANFLLFEVEGGPGRAGAVWEGLVRRSVLVRDFASNATTPGCLRVTVGTPEENTRFLAALRDALAEVRP